MTLPTILHAVWHSTIADLDGTYSHPGEEKLAVFTNTTFFVIFEEQKPRSMLQFLLATCINEQVMVMGSMSIRAFMSIGGTPGLENPLICIF